MYPCDPNPIELVGAEGPLRHILAQIVVSRREHAHIDFFGLGFAEPGHFPLLQDSKEAGLDMVGNVADLIQE
jgi:hypothetical protein